MAAQLVTVALVWTPTGPGQFHEFEAVSGADVFLAYRHRTDYGWSWWEVQKAGSREPARQCGELPRTIQRWAWVPDQAAQQQEGVA